MVKAFHAAVAQRGDEIFRDTAQTETAGGDGHVVVEQAVERSLGIGINFAHVKRSLTTDYTNGSGLGSAGMLPALSGMLPDTSL